MTEDEYTEKRDAAIARGDDETLAELEKLAAEGKVGADPNPPATEDEAFEREVERAARSGDDERLAELEEMAAEGRTADAARTSGSLSVRLAAAREEAEAEGDDDFARQLRSIRSADDPAGALQSALRSATGARYDRLQDLT
jgi:hypothetical protein